MGMFFLNEKKIGTYEGQKIEIYSISWSLDYFEGACRMYENILADCLTILTLLTDGFWLLGKSFRAYSV